VNFHEKINPVHTALVVVAFQRDYFCKGGIIDLMGYDCEALRAIISPLKKFIEISRRYLKRIIFTRQTFYAYLRSPVLIEHYTRAKMIRPFDPSNEEFYQISSDPKDIIVRKHRYSAFIGTHFDNILRANGINTLILTGVVTNVCVESTLRDAFFLDYWPILIRDAAMAAGDQSMHEATLKNVESYFGWTIPAEELAGCLDSQEKSR